MRKPRPGCGNRSPDAETAVRKRKLRRGRGNRVKTIVLWMAQSKVNVYFKYVTFTHLPFSLNLCAASFLESQSHISIPKTPDLKLPLIFKL